MAWALGIDTASREMSIGLAKDGAPAASFTASARATHAEVIGEAVSLMLKAERIQPGDISAIGIAAGPGSFTGLRVGISFVKGFTLERSTKILALSSLESLARAWNTLRLPCVIAAFGDRRGGVVWNRFFCFGDTVKSDGSDRHEAAADFTRALGPEDVVVFDDPGETFASAGIVFGPRRHCAAHTPLQRGLACALAASLETTDSPRWIESRALEPRYFGPTYAERPSQERAA